MRRIRTYIQKNWYVYLFAISCMVCAIVLDMLYPKITQSIVDDVILAGRQEIFISLLA